MSINSISATATTIYHALQGKSYTHVSTTTSSPSRIIHDTIDLSNPALKQVYFGNPTIINFPNRLEMMEEGAKAGEDIEYTMADYDFRINNQMEAADLYKDILVDADGLLRDVFYDSADSSKPITTPDGAFHPQTIEIRAFLENHQAKFDQRLELQTRKFISYAQWHEIRETSS
ncbi:MAG: hypothetical protein JKY45_03845 [Emcibacter sp.]|nr:hypothetical protein [Emcibacter sp.]